MKELELLTAEVKTNTVPRHIAIIMDGNGRWAKQKGRPRMWGHRNGVKSVRTITEAAVEVGVEYLTMYAFSTENWGRPQEEVGALMALLVETIRSEIKTLNKNNVRLQAIGDLSQLPERSRQALLEGIKVTQNNTALTLVLALNYSAKWEILKAVQHISTQVAAGQLLSEDIDETLFSNALSTKGIPDPELMIRTSGETRISNFLLWQIAYAELYFTETLWPDFGKEDFFKAILSYQHRERRFGKTSEQL